MILDNQKHQSNQNDQFNVIAWNFSCMGSEENKISYLKSKIVNDLPTILILLEIKPNVADKIKNAFPTFQSSYSLNIRKPGKHETRNRMLGVMVLASPHFKLKDLKLLDRNVFPERSLNCILEYKGHTFNIVGIHSLAGCSFKEAKAAQFLTLSDYIAEEVFDVLFIDANEPDIEGLEQKDNVYFNQPRSKDKGAKTFFDTLDDHKYFDCFRDLFNKKDYVYEKPLTVSHKIKNSKKEKRYDFLFRKDSLRTVSIDYDYECAVESGGDHSLISAILKRV